MNISDLNYMETVTDKVEGGDSISWTNNNSTNQSATANGGGAGSNTVAANFNENIQNGFGAILRLFGS